MHCQRMCLALVFSILLPLAATLSMEPSITRLTASARDRVGDRVQHIDVSFILSAAGRHTGFLVRCQSDCACPLCRRVKTGYRAMHPYVPCNLIDHECRQ